MVGNYNLEDDITRLHLIMNGELSPDPERIVSDVGTVLQYVRYCLTLLSESDVSTNQNVTVTLEDSLKGFRKSSPRFSSRYMSFNSKRGVSLVSELRESLVGDLLKNAKDTITTGEVLSLDDVMLDFITTNGLLDLIRDLLNKSGVFGTGSLKSIDDTLSAIKGVPKMACVWSHVELNATREYKQLLKFLTEIQVDNDFTRNYRVTAVFKPDSVPVTPEGWDKVEYGLHGSSNFAVARIATEGFSLSKVASGRSLGHGVYFGKLDQASRPMTFMNDTYSTKFTYMLLCKLHHNDRKVYKHGLGNLANSEVYPGELRDCIRVGYRRGLDELVILPEQVEIMYILEVERLRDRLSY